MKYTPLSLANVFLDRYGRDGNIEHMKLQKLAYYAYGWWLAYHDEPILTEGPEVWRYGPVFSSLYNVLAPNGSRAIVEPQLATPFQKNPPLAEGEDIDQLVEWVWGRYGSRSGLTLSAETHKAGTPWQIEAAKQGYRVPPHHRIPDALIRSYFAAQAKALDTA
jgi:uncharacterized phage-associated protein